MDEKTDNKLKRLLTYLDKKFAKIRIPFLLRVWFEKIYVYLVIKN